MKAAQSAGFVQAAPLVSAETDATKDKSARVDFILNVYFLFI